MKRVKNKDPRLAAKRLRHARENAYRDPGARFRKAPITHMDVHAANDIFRNAITKALEP